MVEERPPLVVPPAVVWFDSTTLWPDANSRPVVSASVSDVCAGRTGTPVPAVSVAALTVTPPVAAPVVVPVVVLVVAPVVVVAPVAVGVAVVAAEPAMPAPHAGAVPVFVMTTSVITSRLPAGTANALTGAPASTVRVTATICSMPTGVPVTGVDGVVVPGVGVVPEPVTVVVLPVVVVVTPPDVLGVVDVDGETWVSGDDGRRDSGRRSHDEGRRGGRGDTGADQDQNDDHELPNDTGHAAPSCERMRKRSANPVPSSQGCKHYTRRPRNSAIDRERS